MARGPESKFQTTTRKALEHFGAYTVKNFGEVHSAGKPDLDVWHNGNFRQVELKAEVRSVGARFLRCVPDSVSASQMYSFAKMHHACRGHRTPGAATLLVCAYALSNEHVVICATHVTCREFSWDFSEALRLGRAPERLVVTNPPGAGEYAILGTYLTCGYNPQDNKSLPAKVILEPWWISSELESCKKLESGNVFATRA